VVLAHVDRLADIARPREARNGRGMAPSRISPVLDVEEPTARRSAEHPADIRTLIRRPLYFGGVRAGQQDDGAPYMVTELLDGETLGERLRITSETARVLR
jgi:hypothetical protein